VLAAIFVERAIEELIGLILLSRRFLGAAVHFVSVPRGACGGGDCGILNRRRRREIELLRYLCLLPFKNLLRARRVLSEAGGKESGVSWHKMALVGTDGGVCAKLEKADLSPCKQ